VVNVAINGTAPTWTGWSLDGANITEMQTGGKFFRNDKLDARNFFYIPPAGSSQTRDQVGSTLNAARIIQLP
jgi:hypothetical protein